MALPAEEVGYTFADLLSWDEKERIEIIDGEAFMMATPSRIHQAISMELSRQLANFLEGKQCRVYPAPFGVRLFEQDKDSPEDVDTLVEPDISVVCDRSKLDKYGCKGAPDLIIEILSPSTQRHDQLVKLNLYQRAGSGNTGLLTRRIRQSVSWFRMPMDTFGLTKFINRRILRRWVCLTGVLLN